MPALWLRRTAKIAAAVVRRDPDRADTVEAVSVCRLPQATLVAARSGLAQQQ